MPLPFEKQPAVEVATITNEMVRRLNDYSRRIKNIEQRLERMESRIAMMEETVLSQMGDLKINLDKIAQKIGGVSDRLNIMEKEILRMTKDLGKTALKADVKKLEMFIDIVNPITAKFVTKDELERALEERIRKKA
jgi:TolA-binding protein